MKTILITGGAGFIGSHICLVLLDEGYEVIVIDSFENSSIHSLKRVLEIFKQREIDFTDKLKIFNGDLCDKNFIENVFNKIKQSNKEIYGVIHLAGLKAVSESIFNPQLYWNKNVFGTINLIEIMEKYECLNLVYSSSATIYDSRENSFFNENSQIKPVNPYGNTKFVVEKFLEDIYQSAKRDWKFASLRYFNPIGAHTSGLIGESPKGLPNNIFPLITNTAIGVQKTFKIYGNDWPTKDGTPVRYYIHVMDLAESHIKVLEYLINKKSTYFNLNIGTGIGTSVLELVKIFEKVNGVKVPYLFTSRRPGDTSSVIADNSLLKSKFKLIPKRNIEDMCKDGWKWKRLNPRGYY